MRNSSRRFEQKDHITYNESTNTLFLDKHDYGLLSNASVTLEALVSLPVSNIAVNIVWPLTLMWNKTDKKDRNVYELYFKTIKENAINIVKKNTYFNVWIGNCNDFDYSVLTPFINTYFNLSDEVNIKRQFFIDKYNIDDFNNVVGIYYRGTDKFEETPQVDPEFFLSCLESLDKRYRVLVQTDQKQVLDYFYKDIKDRMFYFEELPLTEGTIGIHKIKKDEKGMSNYTMGINFLASISILSKCRHVIYGTNNPSLWISLLRGNVENTIQIHSDYNITGIHIFNRIKNE